MEINFLCPCSDCCYMLYVIIKSRCSWQKLMLNIFSRWKLSVLHVRYIQCTCVPGRIFQSNPQVSWLERQSKMRQRYRQRRWVQSSAPPSTACTHCHWDNDVIPRPVMSCSCLRLPPACRGTDSLGSLQRCLEIYEKVQLFGQGFLKLTKCCSHFPKILLITKAGCKRK